MTTLALRSLAARKLRTFLSATAVVLGVAMVAGAYIETDQIREAFEGITEQSVEGIDVIVSPDQEFTAGFTGQVPTMSDRVAQRVRAVDGVAKAEGQVGALGNLVVDGEVVETMGAPAFANADPSAAFDPTTVVAGRDPRRPGEATVLDENAADNGLQVGDRFGLVTRHGEVTLKLVGTKQFGETGSAIGGATGVGLYPAELRRLFDLEGRVNSVSVIADPDVSSEELAERVEVALPARLRAQTAEQNAGESAEAVNDQIGAFLTPALLALAGAAVLVGAFIIFNTFSITVAQRTREFAVVRALGASRRQVLGTVAFEAALIGTVASAMGLAAGVGLSRLLNALFDAIGFGIPMTDLALEPRTIVVSLAVGLGVTMAAALLPALRATRVTPVSALSSAPRERSRRSRVLSAAGGALALLLGAALIAQGLFGAGPASTRLGVIAAGAVALFIGVAFMSRYLIRPLAAVIGWPIQRLSGVAGRLARENSERNPGRTATTAAALMVGVGLVVFVAVFAAGLKSSIAGQVDELIRADLVVYGQGFQPLSSRTEEVIEDVDGVEAAVPTPYEQIEVDGAKSNITYDVVIGIDPVQLSNVYAFEWLEGDDALLASLGPGEALVEEQFADAHALGVGDRYRVATSSGREADLTVAGVYRDPTILQGSLATAETLSTFSEARDPISVLVAADEAADAAAVQVALKKALTPFPTAKVESKAEYKETFEAQLDQIVYLLYAMLAMSVIISLFGIANSLFLSIHERTGELGVLRAIGATRSQVRRIIRYESVITAVIGGLLGIAVGVAFGWLVTEALSELGLSTSIPVGQLLVLLALAILVGVLGAIAPARRAARVDVLAAVTQE
jgi:putative ABC transport system permease protein